ncbi:MAG: hypothetical protein JNM00_08030 [Flavobacteriales bacterium]|nr:hypothetical protein [Flavobacteriales bacterium]
MYKLLVIPLALAFFACKNSNTPESAEPAVTETKSETPAEKNETVSASATSPSELEKAWVFESVYGYRGGQLVTDTTGMAMFNNAMKGQEMSFTGGKFTKKGKDAQTVGTYTLSADGKVLTMVDAQGSKDFNVLELTATHLKLQSSQLPTVAVGYKAK